MNEYMNLAIEEAKIAYKNNEVPVGAVIVKNNEVIAKSHNTKANTNNVINHAEIKAIIEASRKMGNWRLDNCEMYITLEPCPMCAGAIAQSRIRKIYIGTTSNIKCNTKIIREILQNNEYYHCVEIEYKNNEECSSLLTRFFMNKR